MGKNTKKRVYLTDEQKKEVAGLCTQYSDAELCKMFDISLANLQNIKRKHGISHKKIVTADTELCDKIKAMRADGLKLNEIAEKLKISVSTVSIVCSGKYYVNKTAEENKYTAMPFFQFDEAENFCYDCATDCKNYYSGNCGALKDTKFTDEKGERVPCPFYTAKGQRRLKIVIDGSFPSNNEYIEACRRSAKFGGKFKAENQSALEWIIRCNVRNITFRSPVFIQYKYYEKNKKRDLDNISSFFHKIFQDALVSRGIIKNDGWNGVKGYSDEFFIDSVHPRIEVEIYE